MAALFAFATAPSSSTAEAAATTPIILTGTIHFVSTIKIASAILANQPITGYVTASAYDYDSASLTSATYQASITAVATRSGNTAALSITLPYLWSVTATPKTISVVIAVVAAAAGNPSTNVTATIPMPANGAVTTVDLPLRL